MRSIHLRILFLTSLALLSAGCAWMHAPPDEQLDELTGVTLSHAKKPIILYRDASSRAAHARDYVHMGAVQVNRMGDLRYYLWLGIWSTIPAGDTGVRRDGFESITLFVEGEPLPFDIAGWAPDAIGASANVYVKPVASAADAYYEVTIDQLRLIATSRSLRLLTSGPQPASYELWNSQNSGFASLASFLQPEKR